MVDDILMTSIKGNGFGNVILKKKRLRTLQRKRNCTINSKVGIVGKGALETLITGA